MKTNTISMLVALILVLATHDSSAQTDRDSWHARQDEARLSSRWQFALGIGNNNWDGIAQAEQASGTGFHGRGSSVSGQLHRRGRADRLLLGGEIGMFINTSGINGAWSGTAFSDETTAWTGYGGPSLRWMIGRRQRASLDFGLGFYDVDVSETVCLTDDLRSCFDQPRASGRSNGGFIGVSGEFPIGPNGRAFSLSLRSHWFDAGEISVAGASAPVRIEGPVTTLQIGYAFRAGRR